MFLLNWWNKHKLKLLGLLVFAVLAFGFGFFYGWKARSNYPVWRASLPWYVRWVAPVITEKPASKAKPAPKVETKPVSGCIDSKVYPPKEVHRNAKPNRPPNIDRTDFDRPNIRR